MPPLPGYKCIQKNTDALKVTLQNPPLPQCGSRWCGVVVRRVPAQVSSTSLDHGSNLPAPSPKSPRVAEQCDVNIQSNTREGMNVCKGIGYLLHAGTIISRQRTSPLVRLFDGEARWEAPDPLLRVSPLNISLELIQITLSPVRCANLRPATGIQLAPCCDDFRGS
ncbi:hypothetical protein TNCV_1151501 [Trichonephila clavipes]|nr:hypothetical protein TNCV_1151501 [Trichonephila clavipes]